MRIVQHPRAPVMTRRERDAKRPELDALPMIELMHDVEPEIVHEIADADRHDDRLIGRDFAQRAPIEVIEVRMRHEHEIDVRQVEQIEAWFLQPLHHFEPHRPVGVDQHVDLFGLDEERSVTDPGDADLALFQLRKQWQPALASALGEERRDENAGEEISLVPVSARPQPDASRSARSRAPFSVAWTTFLRLFLEKGIGTSAEPYNLARVNQNLSRR